MKALAINGFAAASSDQSAGIIEARFTKTPSTYGGAIKDMQAFTAKPLNRAWSAIETFSVDGLGASLSDIATGCKIEMTAQFSAVRRTPLSHDRVELASNGRLEGMILAEAQKMIEDARIRQPQISQPSAGISAAKELPMPAPKWATMILSSSPDGAEITIDGEYQGSTPSTVREIGPGKHAVKLTKRGFLDWQREIEVKPGDSRTISAELLKRPEDPTKPHVAGLD